MLAAHLVMNMTLSKTNRIWRSRFYSPIGFSWKPNGMLQTKKEAHLFIAWKWWHFWPSGVAMHSTPNFPIQHSCRVCPFWAGELMKVPMLRQPEGLVVVVLHFSLLSSSLAGSPNTPVSNRFQASQDLQKITLTPSWTKSSFSEVDSKWEQGRHHGFRSNTHNVIMEHHYFSVHRFTIDFGCMICMHNQNRLIISVTHWNLKMPWGQSFPHH